MKSPYTSVIVQAQEGGYYGYIVEIDGVNAQGETPEEVQAELQESLSLLITYRREQAKKVPHAKLVPLQATDQPGGKGVTSLTTLKNGDALN